MTHFSANEFLSPDCGCEWSHAHPRGACTESEMIAGKALSVRSQGVMGARDVCPRRCKRKGIYQPGGAGNCTEELSGHWVMRNPTR